jgi:hypothetical protein
MEKTASVPAKTYNNIQISIDIFSWFIIIASPFFCALLYPPYLLGVIFLSSFMIPRDFRFCVSLALSVALFAVLEWATIKKLIILYDDVNKLVAD